MLLSAYRAAQVLNKHHRSRHQHSDMEEMRYAYMGKGKQQDFGNSNTRFEMGNDQWFWHKQGHGGGGKKGVGKATARAKEASTMARVSAAVVQPQQVEQNPVLANMVKEKSALAANASAAVVNSLAVTKLAMNSQTT